MSAQENVEALRRSIEATARGDYDAAAAEVDPKVEIDDADIPESTGHDSYHEWLARWDAAWQSWRIENLDIRPAGEDRAVALFAMVVTGRGSGMELTRQDALVADFRDGKAIRIGYYNDQAQALDAAGLAP